MDNYKKIINRIKKKSLNFEAMVQSFSSGSYSSLFKGSGLNFSEVRKYSDGDDARFLDWNVSSRLSEPYVKTFEEEKDMSVLMVIDNSLSMDFGSTDISKKDMVMDLISVITYITLYNGNSIGSIFFDGYIREFINFSKNSHQANRILHTYMNLDKNTSPTSGSNLKLALKTVSEKLKRKGLIFIISDFRVNNYTKEFYELLKNHTIISIMISDRIDYEYPDIGFLSLRDVETDRFESFNGLDSKFKKEYKDFWNINTLNWKKINRTKKSQSLEIFTHDDLVEKLSMLFNKKRNKI